MSKRGVSSKRRTNASCDRRHKERGKGRTAGCMMLLLLLGIITVFAARRLVLETDFIRHEAQGTPTQTAGMHRENAQALNPAVPWQLTLVNKWNPIPKNYKLNLVEVPGGERVDERIYKPLMQMLEAAKEGNLNQLPRVVSGYRTEKEQQHLFDEKVEQYKKEGYSEREARKVANQLVSVPGYSEHQLGFAVDINGATYDVYLWLQKNSYKYGFIFRYPGSKTGITGAAEEVWHYRYVGAAAAAEMHEQELCLEEYLDK